VLVIDVQHACYCTRPPPHDAAGTLRRINIVTRAARSAGRPVIFIQHRDREEFIPGSDGWQLHPDLEQMPGDRYLQKTACDSFYATELGELLRGLEIDTLVVTGYATEFCVDTTLRSATSRGYRVIAVSDGHTTKDRPTLRAEQIKAHHNWVWGDLICRNGITLLKAGEIAFARRTRVRSPAGS
jgi:nicotinamidase-related amidase